MERNIQARRNIEKHLLELNPGKVVDCVGLSEDLYYAEIDMYNEETGVGIIVSVVVIGAIW